jgi:hypothetical protein
MNMKQEERLVVSFERISEALEALSGTGKRFFDKQFPEPREHREAIISRIPTAEDKLKIEQGNTNNPLGEWLSLDSEEEELGPRERAFLEVQAKERSKLDASTKANSKARRSRGASTK